MVAATQQTNVTDQVVNVLSEVLHPANFTTLKFWVFIYLVLCVGIHMAPSWSDYQGAGRASIMVLLGLVAILLFSSVVITDPQAWLMSATDLLSPLLAVLVITVALCTLATVIVSVIVSYFPQRYRVG